MCEKKVLQWGKCDQYFSSDDTYLSSLLINIDNCILINSRLERLKTGGGKNEAMALSGVEKKVKDMMLLSIEGMPSHFDCDDKVDAMPSVYEDEDTNEVDGKITLNLSCIWLLPQI